MNLSIRSLASCLTVSSNTSILQDAGHGVSIIFPIRNMIHVLVLEIDKVNCHC